MKIYFPSYGKTAVLDDDHYKVGLGKKNNIEENNIEEFRDNVNVWIEGSLK